MNVPPTEFIRVAADDLRAFVERAGLTVGMATANATLLADLLTANDLRGVFSHGTTQIATYARLLRDGILNPKPDVHVAKETPTSLIVDGDGGLGYFPTHMGTLLVIEKAKQQGIAISQTRNHGHFGAAGIYSRMAEGHDLLCYVTSGHQLEFKPGDPYVEAAGGSPMSFLSPANEEQSLLLDFGARHDLYLSSPHRSTIEHLVPGTVFRAVGLGAICQSWGGFLAGVPFDSARAKRTWAGANQGSLVIAFRIDLFVPPEQFKAEMDEYVRAVSALTPVEGFDRALLPGAIEAIRAAEYREFGVPVGPEHRTRLEELAGELGLQTPW